MVLRLFSAGHLNRGDSYRNLQQYDKEISEYSKAIELNPDYSDAYYNRGYSYHNLQQYDKAISDYSKAIKLKPSHADAYYNRGCSYDHLQKYVQAISDYSKAIKLNPHYVDAYNNRGYSYHNLRQYDKAILDYSRAIKLNPHYALAYNNRGILYDDLQKYSQAISDYSKAIKLNPNSSEVYNNRGISYRNLRQHEKAISDYSKAIKSNPDYADAYYNRGYLYDDLQKYSQAILDYSKAIKLNPYCVDAYNNRGISYHNLQQYDKAISDYSKAIELDSDYALAYHDRGHSYQILQQYDKAISDYSKAIELNPHYADTHYNRGDIYLKLQQYKNALDCFVEACKYGIDVEEQLYACYSLIHNSESNSLSPIIRILHDCEIKLNVVIIFCALEHGVENQTFEYLQNGTTKNRIDNLTMICASHNLENSTFCVKESLKWIKEKKEFESLIMTSSSTVKTLCNSSESIVEIHPNNLRNHINLREGGQGIMKRSKWKGVDVQVKFIKNRSIYGIELKNSKALSHHPHLVKLYGCFSNNKSMHYLVYELVVNGDLPRVKDLKIPDIRKIKFSSQIADALQYMHSMNIAHGDVKCLNVMLCNNGEDCKLKYYGTVAKSLESDSSLTGTDLWAAPEILFESSNQIDHLAADIYSFGMLMWELFEPEGRIPFYYAIQNDGVVELRVSKLNPPKLDPRINPYIQALILSCSNPEPGKRPKMKQIAIFLRGLYMMYLRHEEISKK